MESILILHDIRSMENVGSLFRTADAAGISRIILSGITPTPIDRFGRVVTKLTKASLGAEKVLPWEHVSQIDKRIVELKNNGYTIVAIEQSPDAKPYTDIPPSHRMVFILGNEVSGIPASVLSLSDYIAEIPMYGTKESLNVSVAGGIALYHFLRHT